MLTNYKGTYLGRNIQVPLVRRECAPRGTPVVVFASRCEPIRLVDKHLCRDPRSDEDRVNLGRIDLARLVQLLEPYVRIRVLQVCSEILILEDGVEHTRDVGERKEIRDRDYHDRCGKPGQKLGNAVVRRRSGPVYVGGTCRQVKPPTRLSRRYCAGWRDVHSKT